MLSSEKTIDFLFQKYIVDSTNGLRAHCVKLIAQHIIDEAHYGASSCPSGPQVMMDMGYELQVQKSSTGAIPLLPYPTLCIMTLSDVYLSASMPLPLWREWLYAEWKQLDTYHQHGMFGNPSHPLLKANIFYRVWIYSIKRITKRFGVSVMVLIRVEMPLFLIQF